MKFQDFDLSKKLPYVKSNNLKVVILGSLVFLLMLITLFSNIYGNLQKTKEEKATNSSDKIDPSDQTQSLDREAPVVVLKSFIRYAGDGNDLEAAKVLSEYTPPNSFTNLIGEMTASGKGSEYRVIDMKYSENKNFAFVTLEVKKETKRYYKFTLIKVSSVWKIFSQEIIK